MSLVGGWLITVILALATAAPGRAAVAPTGQPQTEGWARLGPQGPGPVTAIAVAPGWPTERLLLAVREDAIIRSRDAGASWERLPAPATVRSGHVHFFGLLPAPQGPSTAFLLVQDPSLGSSAPWRLLRSSDAGTSWSVVLTGPRSSPPPRVAFSPNFGRDGVGFLVANGELWRSRTAGASWEPLTPLPGQRVQQVVISPDFASDRTVFLAVTVRDRPSLRGAAGERAADHEESAGVLASGDGGETWWIVSEGLRGDHDPYRNVYDLAVSPTYRADGTLFAFAAGPITPPDPAAGRARPSWTGRLFRSTDRGTTWEPVAPLIPERDQRRVALVLSPGFSADGRAFATVDVAAPTSAGSTCTVLATESRGREWSVALPPLPSATCDEIRALGSGREFSLLVRRGGEWTATPGGTGERLLQSIPEGPGIAAPVPNPVTAIVPGPDQTRDRSVFVGAWGGGIWAYGTNVQRTDGRLPCAVEAGPAFRGVWETEAWVHGWLGCATAAERRTRVREVEFGPVRLSEIGATTADGEDEMMWDLRALWPEDDDAGWYRLSQGSWTFHRSGELPWPEGPSRLLEGAVQHFEGGLMLRLTRPDGSSATLVLVGRTGRGSWREVPAPPPATV